MKKLQDSDHHIFIVSDATGETAEKVVIAALSQFGLPSIVVTRYKEIRTDPQVSALVHDAAAAEAMIVHTIISKKLRAVLHRKAARLKVPSVDLMGNLMELLTSFLRSAPSSEPGLVHKVDEDYFKRIEAMEFVVKHDDGQSPKTLQEADIVLIGASRTTKTPLSIYLARDGWKVANVPLVYGLEPPAELLTMNPRRVIALTIDLQRLIKIRQVRLKEFRKSGFAFNYSEVDHVRKELAYCKDLYFRHPDWLVLDVTGRAVEELANDIVSHIVGRDRNL